MPTEASPRAAKEGRRTDGSSGSRRAARPTSRQAPASRAAAAVARVLHAQATRPSESGTRVTNLRAATSRPPPQTTHRQPESRGVRCRAGGSIRDARMARHPPLPAPAFRTPHGLPAAPVWLCPPLPSAAPPPIRAPATTCRGVPNLCRPRAATLNFPLHQIPLRRLGGRPLKECPPGPHARRRLPPLLQGSAPPLRHQLELRTRRHVLIAPQLPRAAAPTGRPR